jgi:hypothetical protein
VKEKILFKFPELEKEYLDSLQKDLRERKSISELLDYWLPSEDLNYSFFSFLEGILFNQGINGLEFNCQFAKKDYDSDTILNEISKFKYNYKYKLLLENKDIFIINFIVLDNKKLSIPKIKIQDLEYSKEIKKNNLEISSFNQDVQINNLFNFDTYITYDFFKKKIKQFNYTISFNDINLNFFFKDNILVDATFETSLNEYSSSLKILDKFLYFSLNKPIREIADHSAIKTMNFFLNDKLKNYGVLTLKNPLCKEFLDVQEKFRKILIDLNGNKNYENDYKNLNEFFENPPVNWTKMSIQEKIKKCNEFCLLCIKRLSLKEESIKVSRVEKNLKGFEIRIVVEFASDFNINEKSKVLRFLEDLINKSYNYSFDVIAVMSKDKSTLRRGLIF